MTAGERPRLLVFTTHPIQYQAPWFRAIEESGRFELLVAFSYIPTDSEQAVGFGGAFEWDIPLREGYRSIVLESLDLGRSAPDWLRRPTRGASALLEHFRPDVALVLGWQEVSLLQAMRACWRRRVPVILRGESVPRPRRRRLVRWGQRQLVRRAAGFLAIGARNRRFYTDLGVPGPKIVDALYCVDNDRFASAAGRLRARRADIRRGFGIPADALCLLFAGKLEAKKRPVDVIEAVTAARAAGASVHALIVGDGPLRAECESRIAALAAPATMAGFRNQSELPEAYVAADALVLPSDARETWGLVVNEAMACGLPAIVSDSVGCAPDLVQDGETGALFPCGDGQALAAVIGRWADQREVVAAMGRRAEAQVHARYSIEGAVLGLAGAVQNVLGRNATGVSEGQTA
jgi:glycosyltransferase involved in cell wall biosynthesis